jgi:hypothetical protein
MMTTTTQTATTKKESSYERHRIASYLSNVSASYGKWLRTDYIQEDTANKL